MVIIADKRSVHFFLRCYMPAQLKSRYYTKLYDPISLLFVYSSLDLTTKGAPDTFIKTPCVDRSKRHIWFNPELQWLHFDRTRLPLESRFHIVMLRAKCSKNLFIDMSQQPRVSLPCDKQNPVIPNFGHNSLSFNVALQFQLYAKANAKVSQIVYRLCAEISYV